MAGCATHWSARTAPSQIPLQWPFPPTAAKVTFEHSLTGFTPSHGGFRTLRRLAVGGEKGDRNAFVLPVAVAADAQGRIAVADLGRRCVHLFDPKSGTYLRLTGTKQEPLVSPVGVAFDDAGRLFVTDSTGKLFAFRSDGTAFFSLEQAGNEPLRRPTGIAWSSRHQMLYVVDTLADRVYGFRSSGALELAFGERGEGPGQFNFPTHIFCSAAGELVVSDSLNFRISRFDELGKPLGSFGHHGDGSGDLAMPKGVAVDSDGVLYVADSIFDNIQLFGEQGEFLMTLGRRGTGNGEFWLPAGVFLSESGELYVADTYNRRVQVFRITPRYAAATP